MRRNEKPTNGSKPEAGFRAGQPESSRPSTPAQLWKAQQSGEWRLSGVIYHVQMPGYRVEHAASPTLFSVKIDIAEIGASRATLWYAAPVVWANVDPESLPWTWRHDTAEGRRWPVMVFCPFCGMRIPALVDILPVRVDPVIAEIG